MWKTPITRSVVTGDLTTKLPNPLIYWNKMYKMHKHTHTHTNTNEFLGPLFFKPMNSNFQALFKENCQLSRQTEKIKTEVKFKHFSRSVGSMYSVEPIIWLTVNWTLRKTPTKFSIKHTDSTEIGRSTDTCNRASFGCAFSSIGNERTQF